MQFDDLFKFKIGELLCHVGNKMAAKPAPGKYDYPRRELARFIVLERLMQQCPGGVQLHYAVRFVTEEGHVCGENFRLNEIEVRAAPVDIPAADPVPPK